ncbi:MAG: DNA polymerase Y family protein, partial [Actinomycetia bacterium]|nr:DNA polymerase Y family protein [Actinomycetes bacterium]
IAKTMADEMHARLARDGLACTRIIVEAITEAGESLSRMWRHEGALSANDVADRMRWQLDGWLSSRHKPTSGIVLLRLVPDEVIADVGRQLGFWGGQALETERAARALARVQGLLGPDAVLLPERRGGRGLGEAIGRIPLPFVDLNDPDRKIDSPSAAAPWPGRLPAPSPAVLGWRPIAEVVDENSELVEVNGRGDLSADPAVVIWSDGSASAVVSWAGPWPLEEKWWEPQQH